MIVVAPIVAKRNRFVKFSRTIFRPRRISIPPAPGEPIPGTLSPARL
jgi:hypothetical protein